MVNVLDLTPNGVGFESAVPVAVGHTIELLTRIPDSDSRLVDLSLPVFVRSCRHDTRGDCYRIGGTIEAQDEATWSALVEFVFVTLAEERIGGPRSVGTRDSIDTTTASVENAPRCFVTDRS